MRGPEPTALRVLHCPTDVGGHPTGLARAERRRGAESTLAVIRRSPYGYDVDVDLGLGSRGRLGRLAGRLGFLARSISSFDVYHYNFGQTVLPRLGPIGVELPLLRAAGKRLFMTFQGSDARPTADGHANRAKRRAVAHAGRFCHRLFCLNPDLLAVVPGSEFVPYASVDPRAITPAPPTAGSRRPTIVHAPTDRRAKGTAFVIEAVERLRTTHDVELVLVENMPHAEALARYRAADLAIDQIGLGWYGGFAVEMMAMGKPVVCHIDERNRAAIPAAMAGELPILPATADTLTEVLAAALAAPQTLRETGERSRAFVERWHDPDMIARRMLAVYADPSRSFWSDVGSAGDPDGA